MDRRDLLGLLPGAALAVAARPLAAQDRSAVVRIVVPYAAGGQTDLMARVLAPTVGQALDRTVIVENKPGAAALIGTRAVQTATPDGNTLLFHNSGFVALPMLSKGAAYDPVKDFAAVASVGSAPNFLMVHGDVPARTLPEFIAFARSRPDGVTAANSGLGSAGHLATQLLAKRAGIQVTHVPYKGSAETAKALVAGEVQMQLTAPTEVLTTQAKLGKVRFLAVGSRERTMLAPELPTINDTLPGFVFDGWYGLLTASGSPPDRVAQVSEAFGKAMAEPDIRNRFVQLYMEPRYLNPPQFAQAVAESIDFWRAVVTELGIQPA
jgi:tripartite-type tricarboxylate transporter receptor subunit TctC